MNNYHFKEIDYSKLMKEAISSKSKISRRILHTNNSNMMQCMLIAFAPNKIYDFIADKLSGVIVFTCLKGTIKIEYYVNKDERTIKTFMLNPGEILSFPRNYFRSTQSFDEGAIFLESIEGPFKKEYRVFSKTKK